MKIGWGWKIAVLYSCFAGMIVALVVASSKQKFDLVSKDYYKQEIAYQDVLDASKNQASLSAPVAIHANASTITIEFPHEFNEKVVSGDVTFYSPVKADWDKSFKIEGSTLVIPRSELQNTHYTVKIACEVDGKKYYQESEIQLHS